MIDPSPALQKLAGARLKAFLQAAGPTQRPQEDLYMVEPWAILDQLEAVRAQTLTRLDALAQEQLDWRPPPTGTDEHPWSLGEIFMHIAIDEHYLREHIARPLLEGLRPPDGITFLPPPPPYGMPRAAIRFWLERARLMTRRLLENWPADANLDLTHHGGFQEAMNGTQWLLAYARHEAFHHRQIDAVLGQLGAQPGGQPE